MANKTSSKDLVLTRIIDAPRETVFEAWTKPEHMKQWWGPVGFSLPHCTIDFKLGGTCLYCMKSPEGQEFWGKSVYREITKPEKIVVTDTFADAHGNVVSPTKYGLSPEWPEECIIEATFDQEKGKTKLTVHHGVSEELAKQQGCETGWNETLDRLETYVSKLK